MKSRLLILALLSCICPAAFGLDTVSFTVGPGYINDVIDAHLTIFSNANAATGTYTVNVGGINGSFVVASGGTISQVTGAVHFVTGQSSEVYIDVQTENTSLEANAYTYNQGHTLPTAQGQPFTITYSVTAPNNSVFWSHTESYAGQYFWELVNTLGGNPYGNTFTVNARKPSGNQFWYYLYLGGNPEPCPTCSAGNGGSCPTCASRAMATYSLDKLRGSFRITDTPAAYSVPVGPSIGFTLNYNQANLGQLPVQPFANVSPNWTYNWLSYITNGPDDNTGNVTRFAPGGGTEYYFGFTPTGVGGVYNPATGLYSFYQNSAPERSSRATLNWDPTKVQYTRNLPDGSSEIYGKLVASGGTNYYLLTQTTDAQGNIVKLAYDSKGRLTTITDAIGQVTTLSYGLTGNPLLITKVTDPFSRTAMFQYDKQGRLISSTDSIGMISSFTYDSNNNINSMTTPYGTTTFALESDVYHNAVNVTNPLSQTERVELRYNSVSAIPDSDATAIVPTFNSANLPTGFSLTNSGLSSNNTFYWDRKQYAAHNPIQYTDAQITHWQMGTYGLSPAPASTKQPLENRVWYVYAGQTTPNFLDAVNDQTNPCAVGRVLDDSTTQAMYSSYNTQGHITQSMDPIGRTTNYTYDTATGIDLLTVTQKNGSGTDLLSTLAYTNGTQTTDIHLPVSSIDASGQTSTMSYNAQGQILTSVDPKSETTTYTYTGPSGTGVGNYMTTVTAPMTGATTSYTYDSVGRVATVTDSEGYKLTYSYDNLDRRTLVTYPDSTTDQTIYQYLDVIKTIDRQSRTTSNQYDAIREVLQTTDADNRTTKYAWCLCGGLAQLTDANNNVTTWTLDLQGRATAKTYADSTQITYTYENTTSRLHQMQDANGNKAVYAYNKDNTLSGTTYTPGTGIAATPNASFTYDPAYNRVKTMVDGVGTTTYTYNTVPTTGLPVTGANMLGSISVPVGAGNGATIAGTAAVAYTYDQLGRVTNQTIDGSSNNSIAVVYDSLGRVTNVTNPLGAFVYAYVDTTSRLHTLTYPTSTGLVSTMSYFPNQCPSGTGNGDQRLQEISNAKGATNISNFEYTYNPVGTIATWQQQTDANVATQYALTYDKVDQLTNAVNTNTSTHAVVNSNLFAYDLMGNRLAETTTSATNVGQFNTLNQLTKYNTSAVSQTVSGHTNIPVTSTTIDTIPATITSQTNFTTSVPVPQGTNVVTIQAQNSAGTVNNQKVQIVTSGGTTPKALVYDKNGNTTTDEAGNTYTWDALNRLITIKYSSGATSNFAYDGSSRRISIIEKNSSGTVTSTKLYVWVGNSMAEERNATNVVQKRFYGQGEQQSGTAYFYTNDHLGSIRELISSTGAITSRLSYDVYGRTTVVSGTTLPTFQYAHYYSHATSGLYLTQYRAYDTSTGRWLSRDPAGENSGTNIYEYVMDIPTQMLDPDGLSSVTVTVITVIRGPDPEAGIKTKHSVTVDCESGKITSESKFIGTTMFLGSSYPGTASLHASAFGGGGCVTVLMSGRANSYFLPLLHISYFYSININCKKGSSTGVSYNRGYPSYEVYVNGSKIYDSPQEHVALYDLQPGG